METAYPLSEKKLDKIFNPGKKIAIQNEGDPADGGAGTKEYIRTHIAAEHNIVHKV